MPTLTVVAPNDRPVYEASFPQAISGREAVLEQIVLHSSLDMVDEKMWDSREMYLKVVDRYNEQLISAFVTASNYRFLLLHDSRHEDGVKPFFSELHDLFVKVTLNPLTNFLWKGWQGLSRTQKVVEHWSDSPAPTLL